MKIKFDFYVFKKNEQIMDTIKCFTDASYSQQKNIAVIGYKIGDLEPVLDELPNIKNTQAELLAIERCLEECAKLYPNNEIILYTDCQRALKNTNYPPNVTLVKLEGHKKGTLKSDDDKIFSIVDKAVRKRLRQC